MKYDEILSELEDKTMKYDEIHDNEFTANDYRLALSSKGTIITKRYAQEKLAQWSQDGKIHRRLVRFQNGRVGYAYRFVK